VTVPARAPRTRPGRRVRIWPLAAACAYALLIPLQPVLTMPDGSPLRFAAADAVAPLVLLAGLARPRRRLPPALTLVTIAIPLLALFATLWAARERSLSLYAVGKTAGLFYLVALALAMARSLDPGMGPTVLRALAVGALWSAVIGLAAFAASMVGFSTPLVWGGRLCSTMLGDPNIYCSVLAVALLVVATERRWTPLGRVLAAGVLTLAVLATGSRSGLVGVAAGIVVCALVRGRDAWVVGARAMYLFAGAGIAATVFLLTDAGSNAARLLWEHVWRTWTVESRFELYARALEQFGEHPLVGLGIGGFNDLNTWSMGGHGEHFAVHNTYLWAFVDLGVAGGLLISTLIAAGVWSCVRAARRPELRENAAVIAAGLATMSVFNLFVDGFYQRHFWVLMACALALPASRRVRPALAREPRRRPAGPVAFGVTR
jgi:O-antigen ligase